MTAVRLVTGLLTARVKSATSAAEATTISTIPSMMAFVMLLRLPACSWSCCATSLSPQSLTSSILARDRVEPFLARPRAFQLDGALARLRLRHEVQDRLDGLPEPSVPSVIDGREALQQLRISGQLALSTGQVLPRSPSSTDERGSSACLHRR